MIKTIISILVLPFTAIGFLFIATLFLLSTLLFPPRKMFWLVRILCRIFLLTAGQILITEGKRPEPEDGPYLYFFNHGSMLDVFMMGAGIKHFITSVGKASQFKYPIWGLIVKRYGVIPIQRKKLKNAISSLSLLEAAIKEGTSSIISPEGTRTLTGDLLPFKKGPFHVALNTGVTLVPVGLVGAFEAKKKPDWRIKPGILKIRFGTPITAKDYDTETVESLSDRIKNEITNLITKRNGSNL